MKENAQAVLTGTHFLSGNAACCEGALAAGCRFVAGYPITPSTDIVERVASRFPHIGGTFIQMEDELASSIAIQGAVWAGAKAMTVTSGPGFSLMMEHIGLAAMTEVPCVFVNVQRGGPSTGLPTLPAQSDMMQARWGSHGDYEIIALTPNSPQESFDLTVKAFNLAETYRVPVMFLLDECIGHMSAKVVIPPADEIEVVPRRFTKLPPSEYLPFKPGENMVPDMVKAGDGYRIHVTGLTHDERGYPAMNVESQGKLVSRLMEKIRSKADFLADYEEDIPPDCQVLLISYGITSRVANRGLEIAREKGLRVGHTRLRLVWPFPDTHIRELAEKVNKIVVPEINFGQLSREVERCVHGKAEVIHVSHPGGGVHLPERIAACLLEVAS